MTATEAELREWSWAIERCLGYLREKAPGGSSSQVRGSGTHSLRL